MGRPLRPTPNPKQDVAEATDHPGVYRVNGKLETRIQPPEPEIDWAAIAKRLEEYSDSVDIIVLDGGILQIARDPEFPREEWGTW